MGVCIDSTIAGSRQRVGSTQQIPGQVRVLIDSRINNRDHYVVAHAVFVSFLYVEESQMPLVISNLVGAQRGGH
ncbi:hypothetical protein GCM10022251_08630 [Phytohabitans flavus]|uniref:Uncharacterized protein n=1 Tax=Phytohabitans flavus TaxID=1076124 RepID=A0A6F8Y1U1_9ACTN|nr:hypothetical protein Pflav_063580 [Phytohabitans flavus]